MTTYLRGNLIDVRLSNTRDLEAAELFFKQARATLAHRPEKVSTDGHDSYPQSHSENFRAEC
ncbi:MAG: DDE-type integrase/transposase/recombinase [Chloroflexi bacterium]|nr:DDE-type integrase/transposase/recombinase [Chloroflexota bacterium]MBN9397442.1 DDE-type integrase/transposase/recombinase [Candidatus Melainabacteria bacterium]